jgi:erythromycin esterase
MERTAKHVFYLVNALFFTYLSFAQDTSEVVTAWLKQNSIPIKYIEPGHGFSDLQTLKNILQEVKVIGLGEATHGTQEFFKMKHRLVEFLVTQMGFTAFVLESGYSNCQPINDYILTGNGDRSAALTGHGYMSWDTEEFSAMLDWMRAYNEKVPDEKKVRFYGIDVVSSHGVGRENVLAYIHKYAPEKAVATDSLFKVLASEDEKWPRRLNQSVLQTTFMPLHELVNFFTINKNKLVAASSLKEWEQTFKHLEVMEQGLYANVKELPPSLSSNKIERDKYMAQNLLYLMEKERPNTKFMVWQHNWHISIRPEAKTLGYHLRQALGDKYFALGFECYEGTFQSRIVLPDGFYSELRAGTILPEQKSPGWYFSHTGKGSMFLNLLKANTNIVVDEWLETPIRVSFGNWVYKDASENFDTNKTKGLYDGILFIERSTPVHPIKNAKARSANKIGF